jgi:hypothetical protein
MMIVEVKKLGVVEGEWKGVCCVRCAAAYAHVKETAALLATLRVLVGRLIVGSLTVRFSGWRRHICWPSKIR